MAAEPHSLMPQSLFDDSPMLVVHLQQPLTSEIGLPFVVESHCQSRWPCPQDMQAWRAKRAEQALKNAVLDEEAAAKFSTAAAMEARAKREAAEKAHSDALFAASLGSGPKVQPFSPIC